MILAEFSSTPLKAEVVVLLTMDCFFSGHLSEIALGTMVASTQCNWAVSVMLPKMGSILLDIKIYENNAFEIIFLE